eukprot:comp21219_c0_seq1/m.28860 comp21219_c0_seq1/g.28860  ORF comp21219_c0_seq1/g.28860 comp21219_c0_seq1/m.28860 type:complete len:325 (-) comp21219_c0_seq1:237-1211(-)
MKSIMPQCATVLAVCARVAQAAVSPTSPYTISNVCTHTYSGASTGLKATFSVVKVNIDLSKAQAGTYEAICKDAQTEGPAVLKGQALSANNNWDAAMSALHFCDVTAVTDTYGRWARIYSWDNNTYGGTPIAATAPAVFRQTDPNPYNLDPYGGAKASLLAGSVSLPAVPVNYALCAGAPQNSPKCEIKIDGITYSMPPTKVKTRRDAWNVCSKAGLQLASISYVYAGKTGCGNRKQIKEFVETSSANCGNSAAKAWIYKTNTDDHVFPQSDSANDVISDLHFNAAGNDPDFPNMGAVVRRRSDDPVEWFALCADGTVDPATKC